MRAQELTAQQTDPLGALNQRPITLVVALFSLALAIGRTIFQSDPQTDKGMAWLAIVFIALATGVLVVASSPYRAPFGRRSFALIFTLGVLAVIAEAVSTAGHNLMIRDDWGSPALGLLLLACAPYRPGRELLVGAIIGALVVAPIVWLQAPGFATKAPALLFITVGVVPVLTLGVGSAVYSSTFVRLVLAWMDRATTLNEESAIEMRPGIARSVQQDRVTGLNREVVPFFSDLVGKGFLTDADRERAASVATGIRQRIVAEADRSWLEQVMLDLCPQGTTASLVDLSHLAERMTPDQRTAMRALVGAMVGDASTRTSSLGIALHDDAPLVRAVVRVESGSADVAIRQRYAPYFAVLRILFRDLQVDVSGSFLTLRFSYDQH